jgi:hypothetical protein
VDKALKQVERKARGAMGRPVLSSPPLSSLFISLNGFQKDNNVS